MIKILNEIIYFIKYLFNYKENVEELANLTQKYDEKRSDISKLNEKINFLDKRANDYLDKINEKNKRIRQLQKQNKFLMGRDNKLQQIETMFENKKVVLRDLKEIVRGE